MAVEVTATAVGRVLAVAARVVGEREQAGGGAAGVATGAGEMEKAVGREGVEMVVATADAQAVTAAPRVATEATARVGLLVVEVASVVRQWGPAVALRVMVRRVAVEAAMEMAAVARETAASAGSRGVAWEVVVKVAVEMEEAVILAGVTRAAVVRAVAAWEAAAASMERAVGTDKC
jgi:hypothetical protein